MDCIEIARRGESPDCESLDRRGDGEPALFSFEQSGFRSGFAV